MQSTARLELDIDLLEKRRQALESDLAYKKRQYDDSMPCDEGMSDPDVAVLMLFSVARDRDRIDSEIAQKKLEMYDLQGGEVSINEKDVPPPPQPAEKARRKGVTGGDGTHAGRILYAAAALAGADGSATFSRKAVCEYLGLNNRVWQSGYTAIFQGMRDDHPGGAPKVGDSYSGVFHRVDQGTYELSAKGRRLANQVRLTERMKSSFRNEFPRVYELMDMLVDPSHPDAYFQDFEKVLKDQSGLYEFCKVEGWLAALDDAAWHDLKQRAAPLLLKRESGRGWQGLFDILRSEARAFGYLQSIGCTGVHFIARTDKKTPDLGALQEDGRSVFCEVKTINISDDEAEKRSRGHGDDSFSRRSQDVSEGFLRKLSDKLAEAVVQLDAANPKRQARRMIFTMLHFDDWWGDHQARYITQIDAHLLQHPVDGAAELVFCLRRNLPHCEPPSTMKSATICFE